MLVGTEGSGGLCWRLELRVYLVVRSRGVFGGGLPAVGESAVFAADFDEAGDASNEEEENAEEDGCGDEPG